MPEFTPTTKIISNSSNSNFEGMGYLYFNQDVLYFPCNMNKMRRSEGLGTPPPITG